MASLIWTASKINGSSPMLDDAQRLPAGVASVWECVVWFARFVCLCERAKCRIHIAT